MFAQTGAGFVAAKFTPDGDRVITLFSDCKAYLWTYGYGKFEMSGDVIQLWDGRVSSIDIGGKN